MQKAAVSHTTDDKKSRDRRYLPCRRRLFCSVCILPRAIILRPDGTRTHENNHDSNIVSRDSDEHSPPPLPPTRIVSFLAHVCFRACAVLTQLSFDFSKRSPFPVYNYHQRGVNPNRALFPGDVVPADTGYDVFPDI
jgi:hypothetical protein